MTGWEQKAGAVDSDASKFGGKFLNRISQYFSDVDIGTLDSTLRPIIATATTFKNLALFIRDANNNHTVNITSDDQTTNTTAKFPAQSQATDYISLRKQTEELENKTIDATKNTLTNLPAGTWDRDATETLTHKTINTVDNTITATSTAAGDLMTSNGTKFVRKARGSALQVLRTNSGATDIEWASLDSGGIPIDATLIFVLNPSDGLCKEYNGRTLALVRTSASSSAADVTAAINTGLSTDLTAGRTWKERVVLLGNFLVTKVQIPSYTIFDFTGANIKQANATNDHCLVNSDTTGGNTQIEIRGGNLDGNHANQTPDDLDYNARNCIEFSHVTDSRITGVYEINSNGEGIMLHNSANIVVDSNYIKGAYKEGVGTTGDGAGQSGSKIIITNNMITNTGESFFGTLDTPDVVFANNYCDTCGTTGINFNGKGNVIANNIIKNFATWGIVTGTESTPEWHGDYSRVMNNTIICGTTGTGGIGFGISQPVSDVIVIGNYIEGWSGYTGSASSGYGIRFSAARRCKIFQNIIRNFARNGIELDGYSDLANFDNTGCEIVGNTISDCGQYTSATNAQRAGIYIVGSTTAGTTAITATRVRNNKCYDAGSGKQLYGLAIEKTHNLMCEGNDLAANVTSAVLDNGNHAAAPNTPVLRFNNGYTPASNLPNLYLESKGTALQVIRTNSGATDIEWASLDSEKVGKHQANGDNSTTVFNIAHGLGATPTYAFAQCSSLTNTYTYTTTSTNIVVTFSTAPPSGTNNVVIYWRVVA